MSEEGKRDELLRSLEQVRASAKKLENEATALHHIVRFDHRSSGADEWAQKVEGELEHLAGALHRFRDLFEQGSKKNASDVA